MVPRNAYDRGPTLLSGVIVVASRQEDLTLADLNCVYHCVVSVIRDDTSSLVSW